MRSYAKLVGVPESAILGLIDQQAPIKKQVKVTTTQNYSLGKHHKKREGWLMKLTLGYCNSNDSFSRFMVVAGSSSRSTRISLYGFARHRDKNSPQENTNTIESPLSTLDNNSPSSEG